METDRTRENAVQKLRQHLCVWGWYYDWW